MYDTTQLKQLFFYLRVDFHNDWRAGFYCSVDHSCQYTYRGTHQLAQCPLDDRAGRHTVITHRKFCWNICIKKPTHLFSNFIVHASSSASNRYREARNSKLTPGREGTSLKGLGVEVGAHPADPINQTEVWRWLLKNSYKTIPQGGHIAHHSSNIEANIISSRLIVQYFLFNDSSHHRPEDK